MDTGVILEVIIGVLIGIFVFYLLLPWTVRRGKVWYKEKKAKRQKASDSDDSDDDDDGEFRRVA